MRPSRIPLVVPALMVLAVAPVNAQRRMELADMASLLRLSDPQVSPDGKGILLLVSRPDYQQNAFETSLVEVTRASGAQRVLVSGRRGLGAPRWSPDGTRIGFLASVAAGPGSTPVAGRQVFLLSVAGGEASQITNAPSGVRDFAWRPDGSGLAYLATDEPAPRAGEDRHNDSFEVEDDDYLTAAAPRPAHLWLTGLEGGTARRLTTGSWSLATSLGASPISWFPDGSAVAVNRFQSAHSGDTDQRTIQVVDAGTGTLRALTKRAGREGGPAVSPDGRWIAYTYPRDGDPANLSEIRLAPASGGEDRTLTRALDRHVTDFAWLPDGQGLIVGGTDGTRSALWLQPLEGAPRRLPLGEIAEVVDLSPGPGGGLALIGSEPGRPPELYYAPAPGTAPKRLTDFHRGVAALTLGRSEGVRWSGPDGLEGDGVLTSPPDFAPGRRYPLVLLIHGGPTASSTEGFSALTQLLAARGWVVFEPNYRGSDNRGHAYQRAIAASAAEGPGRDIMAGIEALKRRGLVDTTRMAVSGWSYGGFLTAWLIGRYPGVWRAAVAGAAAISLLDMYDLSDLNVMRRHFITGSPWVENRLPAWIAESPMTHAWKIRTPTLILSMAADSRVAVTGSYALRRALRDNGVPTQFIAYPGPGHSPPDPVRQRDVNRRWVEWLERYLDGER